MNRLFPLCAAAFLSACAPAMPGAAPDASGLRDAAIDALAERYVKLQLAIGTHEHGYIDAYYGPAQWQAAAAANPGTSDLAQ